MLLLDKLRERCGLGLVCSNPPHVYMDIATWTGKKPPNSLPYSPFIVQLSGASSSRITECVSSRCSSLPGSHFLNFFFNR